MANVLVTGGSRGIGAATVRAFAQQGHRVWFLYEKEHTAAQTVARETGAVPICCDVASLSQVQEAFSQIDTLDILVCNAGICRTGLIQDISEEDWDRQFAVNVKGMYTCIREAVPLFLQKQKGSIVTVSSMWGQVGASCESVYSATKGAVIALSKALAQELGPCGVRVNCVAPGVICTDMCAGVAPDVMEGLRQETPLLRLGQPDDIAKAILYLAEADFVTGQVLGVSGGLVL